MRFDQTDDDLATAAHVVNRASEIELTQAFTLSFKNCSRSLDVS